LDTFSSKLATARLEIGLSQKKLADALYGIPHRTLQDWELGRRIPPEWLQKLLLDAIGRL